MTRRRLTGLGAAFERTPPTEAAAVALHCFGVMAASSTWLATESDDTLRLAVTGDRAVGLVRYLAGRQPTISGALFAPGCRSRLRLSRTSAAV